MEKPTLSFFLSPEAKAAGIIFKQPRPQDAGFDLPCLEAVCIAPQCAALIRTGVHVAIPENYVGFVKDRSSVALRGGAISAGVIDSSYRGEIKVVMTNHSKQELNFQPGDRIAQLVVFQHLPDNHCQEAPTLEALGSTSRQQNGFGSTGL